MAIKNYTTKINAIKTIAEIQQNLVAHGARKIVTDYDENGNPIAVTFNISVNENEFYFSLPCNWQGVFNAIDRNTKIPKSLKTKEQALRVSWRILKDWIDAQMAIVEAELANVVEVFLPYLLTKNNQTLYNELKSGQSDFLLLSNG